MTRSGASSRLLAVALSVSAVLAGPIPVLAQAPSGPVITSPADGAVLKGQVQVSGVTDIPGFASSEVAFAYDPDPTGTWFTLQAAGLPVTGGTVATWDTTSVSDGDYILRLRVILADATSLDALVKVKVRNYTIVPTDTPAVTPTATVALQFPTAMLVAVTSTATAAPPPAFSTPTALPPNPARVTTSEIFSGFWRGALIVGLLVLVFGALVRLRR